MNVNDHIISLRGKASILEPLTLGEDVKLLIEGEIESVKDTTNEDGTINRKYSITPKLIYGIEHLGQVIKVKDKSKLHSKIRGRQHVWAEANDSDIQYEEFGSLLIRHFDDVMNMLIEKRNE